MKYIKRKIEVFSFYDKTGIERHLEKMAGDGWLLEKISALFWTYRKIEPKKIRFSISYYATIDDFEPEPTEEQQEFNEFCEHSGWKLAASSFKCKFFITKTRILSLSRPIQCWKSTTYIVMRRKLHCAPTRYCFFFPCLWE